MSNKIITGTGADLVSLKQVINRRVRDRFILTFHPKFASNFLSLFSLHRAVAAASRSIRRSVEFEPKRDDSTRSKKANSCWRTEFFRIA
ncbi:MAG TPA: hypothetical protein VHY59_13555 [Chthoniobacterales bacterium]|nr:hypothetical protein [Chthoniobacterales bacterium]